MTTTTERLLQLADEYQKKADGLRLAAAELNGHRIEKKHEHLPAQLVQAIKIRKGHGKRGARIAVTKLKTGEFARAAVEILNQAKTPLVTDEFRRRLEAQLGVKVGAAGFGSLTRYGYARITKDGYVGTGKPFVRPVPPE